MSKSLIIVESAGKIKKIQKFLGSGYIVKACFGHFRDLPSKDISVDIDNKFKPTYKITKQKIVNELKTALKKCSTVYLACDKDREGEAIAYHLVHVLKLKEYKRIVFTEITKSALLAAIKNATDSIDKNMFYAQQARRVGDRVIGYKISPILWKCLLPNLSGGRVQSVVEKIIVDREREIEEFFKSGTSSFFKTKGQFKSPIDENSVLESILYKGKVVSKVMDKDEIVIILGKIKDSIFKIKDIEEKESKRSPSAPFTTSTMQQEASSKCGMSPKITMSVAQKLYENGYITYMRTDSTSIAAEAMDEIKKYIIKTYSKKYYKKKIYKTKSKNAQEAHECIRPTDINNIDIDGTPKEKKLYNLIWRRTVASQMAPAKINIMTIIVGISKLVKYSFRTSIETIIFDGFLKVYSPNKTIGKKSEPPKVGTKLELKKATSVEEYNKPKPRYTEASLGKKIEDLGIGRPSTFASMITIVQTRLYAEVGDVEGVERESCNLVLDMLKKVPKIKETKKIVKIGQEKKKLIPTELGIMVTDYLSEHFPTLIDYSFTEKFEVQLDEISNGNKIWYNVLDDVYSQFKPKIEELNALPNTNKSNIFKKDDRVLGTDPISGEEVIGTRGKYGPYVKMGKKSGPIKKPLTLKKITLEQALEILKYPYVVCKYDNKQVQLQKGRYGLYLKWNNKKITIPEDISEEDLNVEKVSELIKDTQKNVIKELSNENNTYYILDGPYGPYVSWQKTKKRRTNVKIPKIYEPKDLNIGDIEDIIKKHYSKPKKVYKNFKKK